MSETIRQAARNLVGRALMSGQVGTTIAPEDMNQLVEDMCDRFPNWLADLLMTVPLSGLVIGWQADEPGVDYDGVSWLVLSDARGIRSESLECYPGLAILPRGFINIGSCSLGSGNPYFISADEGDDPPVYQVYHDISDKAEEILAGGRILVADSLSGFFQGAIIDSS